MMKFFIIDLICLISISFIKSYNLPSKCGNNQYYDTLEFECRSCLSNKSISSDGLSCECDSTSIIEYTTNNEVSSLSSISNTKSCSSCTSNQVSSSDRTTCQSCPSAEGISPSTRDCNCSQGYAITEKNSNGEYLTTKQCTQCGEGAYQYLGESTPVYECKRCPLRKIYDTNTTPWNCECATDFYVEFGGECFERVEANYLNTLYPSSGATSVLMSDAETDQPRVLTSETISDSATIRELYFKSAFKCLKFNNKKACQTLANLCVLQMYNLQNDVCQAYQFINNLRETLENKNSGARKDMPWLYYQGNSTQIINNTNTIKFTPSFDPNDPLYVNKMEFYLATFTLEGDFLGIEPLTNQLNLCSDANKLEYISFGQSVKIECEIDYYAFTRLNYTTHFYELFFYDPIAKDYIPVPIKINNIPNEKGSWGPNNSTKPDEWILTRRFFMVDNIAGIQGTNAYEDKTVIPSAIRYPHLLKFQFVLANGEDPKIYVPYLELYYKTKRRVLLNDVPSSIVFFEAQYTMNIDHLLYVFKSIFITLNFVIIIHVLLRMYSWYQLNPPNLSKETHNIWMVYTFFLTYFQIWGFYMFWFTICITGYFWIFLKLQYQVFLLLYPVNPEAWWDNNRSFDIIWGIGCAFYFIYILSKISQQTDVDVFFIDWEHDKNVMVKNAEQRTPTKHKGVWRVLFLANRLNSLQTKRRISLEFAFAILSLFWYHFEWHYLGYNNATTKFNPDSPDVYLMRFFICGIILIIIGLVYIIGRYILDIFIPGLNDKLSFIDLLSLCNTSLFVLDSSLHGYYVHGQSPSGKADASMEELVKFLDEEEIGRAKPRSLVDNENDQIQSYEVFISYKMRKEYDTLFANQALSMFSASGVKDQVNDQSRLTNLLTVLPKNFPFNFIINLKDSMNTELKYKIQKISNQPNKYVLNKNWGQRLLDLPPAELANDNSEDMLLYRDRNDSFDNFLLFGVDWEWYLFNIYTFQMWMLTLESCAFSMMMTLLLDRILIKIRDFSGEKNLSRKTIIDNNFFVV